MIKISYPVTFWSVTGPASVNNVSRDCGRRRRSGGGSAAAFHEVSELRVRLGTTDFETAVLRECKLCIHGTIRVPIRRILCIIYLCIYIYK